MPTIGLRYEPKIWNFDPDIHERNCLTYACNIHAKVWLMPGQLAVNFKSCSLSDAEMQPNALDARMQKDGFIRVRPHADDPAKNHVIILQFRHAAHRVQAGFHALRMDADGTCSYKEGPSFIHNRDYSERMIIDPRIAITGYPITIGFYKIPDTGLAFVA